LFDDQKMAISSASNPLAACPGINQSRRHEDKQLLLSLRAGIIFE
jgi:hypothetical protein